MIQLKPRLVLGHISKPKRIGSVVCFVLEIGVKLQMDTTGYNVLM